MIPEEAKIDLSQEEETDLTADEAAASLSFATTLGEKMLMPMEAEGMEQPQEEGEVPEQPQEQETPAPTVEEPKEETPDIEAIVDAKVEEKMQALREELSAALNEEDEQEE